MEELFQIKSPGCLTYGFWFLSSALLFNLIDSVYRADFFRRFDAEEGANHDLQRIPSRCVRLKRAEDERKAGRPFDPSVANGYKIDDDSDGDRSSGLCRQTQLTELGMEDPATAVIFCKNELFRIPAACASFLWLFLNTCFLNLIGFIYRAYYHDRVDAAKERSISRKILREEECEITAGDEKKEECGFSDRNAADRKRDDDEDGAVYRKLLQHLNAEQEVIELSLEDQSDSSQTDSGLNKGGSDSSKHTERKMEVVASKPDSKKERTPIALSFLRAEDFGYYMEAMNRSRGGNGEVEMEVSSSVGSNFDDSSEGGATESTFDEDEFLTEADFIYIKPRPTPLYLSSAGDLEEETKCAESESLEDLSFSYGFLGEKYGADGKIELVFLDSFPKIAEKEEDRDEDDDSGVASSVSSEQNEWINDFMASTTPPQYEVGDQESIGDAPNHSEMQGLPNSDDLLQFPDTEHRNSCEDQDKNDHHRSKLHDQLQFQSPQSGNTCEDQARNTDHHTETNPDDLLQFQGTQCRNSGDDQVKNNRHQADPCDLLQLQIPQSENSVEDQDKSTDRHTDPDDLLQLLHTSRYRKEPPQLQPNSDNAEDTTDLNLHTNVQHPEIVLVNIRDLELQDHKKFDSEIDNAVLITAEYTIQNPHSPAKTREDSLNEDGESFRHSPLDFDREDGVNVRENRKATSSPSSGWAEEEDDGFEELWEHQDFIEQLRSDIRKARATGLPTIKEETEWPMEKVMDDLKQWKTTTGKRTAHLLLATAEQDPMEELRTFYRSYSQRMRRFDVLNYQKTYAMGFLKLRDPIRDFASLKPTAGKGPISKSDDGAQSGPSAGFLRELHVDLETVYVGQMCLSWEFLHWQYVRTQELYESNPRDCRHYQKAADEFQSFHVLLTRFTEDEHFKGPRVHNYVNTRCTKRNMLQVPLLREEKTLERMDGEEGASLQCLVQVMEECMRAFWEFIKSDKGEAAPAFIKGLKQVENQNLVDAERLADIKASAQKKDKRLKDLMKSGSCLVKRFQRPPVGGWMNESLFFSLVDVALVKRVVKMTRVTREQAEWCQNKLLNIHFKNRNKLIREQSFLLFPC